MVHIHTRAYKNTRTQTHIHMVVPRLSIPTGLKCFGFTASEGKICPKLFPNLQPLFSQSKIYQSLSTLLLFTQLNQAATQITQSLVFRKRKSHTLTLTHTNTQKHITIGLINFWLYYLSRKDSSFRPNYFPLCSHFFSQTKIFQSLPTLLLFTRQMFW